MIKALCLGAKGVGMGRPFLYSLTYGEEGVVHAIESKFKSPSLSFISSFRVRALSGRTLSVAVFVDTDLRAERCHIMRQY